MPDEELEMGEMNEDAMESASLISQTAKEKSASLARAAYRADVASQRAMLLAMLIIPILIMIVLWQLFDSNANWGFSKSAPPRSIPRP